MADLLRHTGDVGGLDVNMPHFTLSDENVCNYS